MEPMTELALITCDHGTGKVASKSSQSLVWVAGAAVLVGNDPGNKMISGCSNLAPTIKPCTMTMAVEQGKSAFVSIDGVPVCLDTVVGGTDGTPPSATKYRVRAPGQIFVHIDA